MNLYRQQKEFWPWFFKALRTLIKADPARTLTVIAAMGVGRITSLVALILPLKVVLLAGSDGVPRYFRFFIDPADKGQWIIYFALAAVVLYLLTLLLDSLSERLMQSTSSKVLGDATQINVVSNQDDRAQTHFSRFCRVTAYTLFFAVGLAVIAYIQSSLFYFLCVLIFIFYLFTGWVVSGPDDLDPGPLKALVIKGYRNYISTLSSLTFLSGFFVILLPFLRGAGGNVLFSIVALLLMRQMLSAGTSALRAGVMLSKQRVEISSLMFPEQYLVRKEPRADQAFRDAFEHQTREAMVLGLRHHDDDIVGSTWVDCSLPGVSTFSIRVESGEAVRFYQHQVFMPRRAHVLENEEFLFRHLNREALWAPRVVSRFAVGAFECQLCDAGSATPVGRDFLRWERRVLFNLWSQPLPSGLVEAYASAHPALHVRLDEALLSRLGVAIDTEKEMAELERVLQALPAIQKKLRDLPACLHNTDINPFSVLFDEEGSGVLVMSWGRWRIEPLGALMPRSMEDEEIIKLVDELKTTRKDIDGRLSYRDVMLARSCWHLDRHIQTRRFNKAFDEILFISSQLIGNVTGIDKKMSTHAEEI